jgi:hypothetical protein
LLLLFGPPFLHSDPFLERRSLPVEPRLELSHLFFELRILLLEPFEPGQDRLPVRLRRPEHHRGPRSDGQ